MSHIFDALQRSGTERSGIAYSDVVSVVTKVFEGHEEVPNPESKATVASIVTEMSTLELPTPEEAVQVSKSQTITEFPSVDVHLNRSSKFVAATDPESLAAEKFRFLGVRLRQLQNTLPIKKVLVTSSIPEEGKSLVSANLAAVLARRKQRVLLVDGDLRRPVLGQQFGLGRLKGVADWLRGDLDRLDCIYHLQDFDFWLMPAGEPPADPLELMSQQSLCRLMEQASDLFDWIIVDSPPLLPLADTTVWTRVTDGVLLVTRVGNTEKPQLLRGLEVLKKNKLIGVVMNSCTNPHHDNYYRRYSPSPK
jgi:capsular exopolysaccharide synthesis family protein